VTRRPLRLLILISSVLPLMVGCGKKGAPLAPLRPVPAVISDLTAARLADTVRLQFTVPARNADGTTPSDLALVDVYALSGKAEGPLGRPLTTREFEQLATRVARIEVQPPPPPGTEDGDAPAATASTTPPTAAPPPDARPAQGAVVHVEEAMTPGLESEVFVHPDAAKVARLREVAGDAPDAEAVPSTAGSGRALLWPQPVPGVSRAYVAIPYSTTGRAGPASTPLLVPFVAAPPTPPAPVVTHTATSIELTWTSPRGIQLPIQRTVTPEIQKAEELLPARPLVTYGTAHTYRVYQMPPPGAPASEPSAPLNPAPLEVPAFTHTQIEFGVPRCYALRTVERRGNLTLESALSPVTCHTAIDTYPPPAPTGLVAVGSEGGISLIWEPVTAPDLAGYLVLRGVEGEALKPITAAPLTETTFRDTTTQAGVMYIYAVVSADRATPANVSPESNRVRESAR